MFFPSAVELRHWLAQHAGSTTELVVGFYKLGSKRAGVTWPEAVDEALCVGWVDGVRARIDDVSYRIRFTPRKSRSTWSAINIGRVQELMTAGRMTVAGLQAFSRRTEDKSRIYSYEQSKEPLLSPEYERLFRNSKKAWVYFEKQPPGYRKKTLWWVTGAKQEATRQKRLAALIAASLRGERL